MSEQTREAVRTIRARLHRTARRIELSQLLFGIISTLAAASAAWVLLAATESVLWMGSTARSVALGLWVVSVLSMLAFLVAPPALRLLGLTRRIQDDEVALRIGERFPDVSDRLINLIHLSSGKAAHSPDSLLDGAIAMLTRQVDPVRIEDVERFERPRRAAIRAVAAPAALLLFAILAPEPFTDASARLLAPGTEFERPAPFALQVTPGDVELTRGDALTISVDADGRQVPAEAVVLLHPEDVDQPEPLAMTTTGTGRFEHRVRTVRQNMRYRIEADGVASPWFDVTVIERPFIRALQVRVDYPGYTGLPSQHFAPDQGDVTALRGSRIHVTSTISGQNIESVAIEFDESDAVEMTLDGDAATASFPIHQDDTYRIVARSTGDIRNADPISYRIEPLDDARPRIQLVSPEDNLTLDESLETVLGGVVVDDYGFSRLELRYRLAESRYRTTQQEFGRTPLPLETPRPLDQEIIHAWRLSETGLDPVPGDVIEYYLEIWDNDTVSGPKSSRSQVQRLRVPSLAERYEELDRHQDATADELQQLLEEAGDIREDFDQLRDELRGRQEADWQSRRQVESLQQRQEEIEQRVDDLARRMEDATRQMEQNNLLSEETVEMYRELTRVVEEIKSPELMEALKQLQEAMEQLDLQQMQESLQEFEFNEDQYRQRLERSLELFKRARTIQQLEQAERMARDLAERQEALREATEQSEQQDAETEADQEDEQTPSDQAESDPDADPSDANEQTAPENEQQSGDDSAETGDESSRERLADEQERLSEEMEALEEKLDEVRQQMEESRSAPNQEMDQLRDQVREQQLPEQMRQTGQQIRSDQMQDAGRNQQQMQEQLEQLQQQLGQMRSGMSGAQMQMNLSSLRRTIRDVISLSQEQESLQNSTVEKGSGSPALREMARNQVRIAEGVGVVADSVQSLASEIPQMSRAAQRHTGEALREMGRATEALAERASREAGTHQRAGMTHLNELALMLSDLLDQMMSQQGGSGGGGMSAEQMAEQLQQMSQDQQRLNEQIQQMLNDAAGDRLSSDMQERLRQMAAQQDAIRRQLRQLSRDPAARDELMNDLNRIADQMQETIEELQQRGARRETIQRQQQILTRLLEAEQSLQEREQDERRRGRTGDDVQRESPPELQRSEELEKLRRDLLRALDNDYSSDYEELIRRYFELLRREVEQQ